MDNPQDSDRQAKFTADLERCHELTQTHIAELLSPTPPQESLIEALRQTQTLKGLATTAKAWGLANLGADFEKLLEVASACFPNEREKANEIFQFILDHQQDWFVMNQFTGMEMLPEAWDIYQGLRVVLEERWPGCLPPVESGAGASTQLVEVNEAELPQESLPPTPPAPEPVPEWALPQEMPPQSLPTACFVKPSFLSLLHVVPPPLRRCESSSAPRATALETNRDVRQNAVIAPTPSPAKLAPPMVVSPNVRQKSAEASTGMARPRLLPVILPNLRRADVRSRAAI